MIDARCLGSDIDRSKISPNAEVDGASYLTGPQTSVAPGAVIRDARLHNVVVEAGALVIDSICVAEGRVRRHKCDAAGKVEVGGADRPVIAAKAAVRGSTLINTAVAAGANVVDTYACDCHIGETNDITAGKLVMTDTAAGVKIAGPTELSEAYVGQGAAIDHRGYFEGVFSNAFRQVRFDAAGGQLKVIGTIELPHVSIYGTNTINSTNSGKLLAQPGGIVRGFGKHVGLWSDSLLSHEQIELGPGCWVVPWTKVVGQSPDAHANDDELVRDELMTYLMPFSMGGVEGGITRGLVMPGELSFGLGPKQRRGAWVFTYAVDCVIRMVQRLHAALEPSRKPLADTIVEEAIETAMAMTAAMAARHGMNLDDDAAKRAPGWPRWIAATWALLKTHRDARLWKFSGGRPVEWRREGGKWTHARIDQLLAVAPDALENQKSQAELFAFDDPAPATCMAVPAGSLGGTCGAAEIHPQAIVEKGAFVGPGCRIGSKAVIESGAFIWNSVVNDCRVHAGARLERSTWEGGTVGERCVVRSCRAGEVRLHEDSMAEHAVMRQCDLARQATVSTFGDLLNVRTHFGTILGGVVRHADIRTYLMSMHMAGGIEHLVAVPTPVETARGRVSVPAIPMIGGGAVLRGTEKAPVMLECSFIGSNSIIEAGSYVGFGCFVLGELGSNEGLLPLTVSTGGGPGKHQIGGVLGSLASTVITHFVNWTYQAAGPEMADAVGGLVSQSIRRGIAAIEEELKHRRQTGKPCGHALYKSLADYTNEQLASGLEKYRRALESDAWDLRYENGQLLFANEKGQWQERAGSAFWKVG